MPTLLAPDPAAPPDIDNDLTRRRLIGAGGAALVAVLAACRSASTDGVDDTDEATSSTPPTRTFTDDLGRDVEIPSDPQRIVVLNEYDGAAQILDLGRTIVGVPTRSGEIIGKDFGATPEQVAEMTPIGESFEPDLEAIAAIRPDLIAGWASASGELFLGVEIPDLEAIAPTVIIASGPLIQTVMQRYAELLDAKDALADLKAEYEARLTAVRDAVTVDIDQLQVAHISYFGEGEIRIQSPEVSPFGQALTALGVAYTDSSPVEANIDVSFEEIGLAEADVLFTQFDVPLPDNARQLYDDLGVVRAGQDVPTPEDTLNRTYGGLLGALDLIEPVLTRPGLDASIV